MSTKKNPTHKQIKVFTEDQEDFKELAKNKRMSMQGLFADMLREYKRLEYVRR